MDSSDSAIKPNSMFSTFLFFPSAELAASEFALLEVFEVLTFHAFYFRASVKKF